MTAKDHHTQSYKTTRLFWVVFCVFVITAAALRLTRLEEFPAVIHNDESAAATATSPPFSKPSPDSPFWGFSEYGGHCNFGPWLTAIPGLITGEHTLYSTRVAAAISGVASIVLFGLFTLTAYGPSAALLCLACLIPFNIHMHFSRTGYTYVHSILAFAAVSYAVALFARRPTFLRALALGITLGLAVMTYSATHVLPGAVIPAILAVFFSEAFKRDYPTHRFVHALKLCAAFTCGVLLVTGRQIMYLMQRGNPTWRPNSQFLLNTDVIPHRLQHLGPDANVLDVFWDNLLRTLQFFYERDGAVQFGSFKGLLPVALVVPAAVGCLVLFFHLVKREPIALYITALALLTVIGSALMVEASFSPHLIAFALLCPLVVGVGADFILRILRLRSLPIVSLIAIAGCAAWIPWNVDYLKEIDRRKYTNDTDILRLKIDRKSVQTILNLSSKNGDFKNSFYTLQYPNAKDQIIATDNPSRDLSTILSKVTCPCLLLVDAPQEAPVTQALQQLNRSADSFPSQSTARTYFLVR